MRVESMFCDRIKSPHPSSNAPRPQSDQWPVSPKETGKDKQKEKCLCHQVLSVMRIGFGAHSLVR